MSFSYNNRPTLSYDNGFKEWQDADGYAHRENGPATIYSNGDKVWRNHGKLHRLNGPAVELINGVKEWWYNGYKTNAKSQEEFERYLNLKAFW